MANWLDQTIEELTRNGGSSNDPLVKELREKREELGNNATDDEIKKALRPILLNMMASGETMPDSDTEEPDKGSGGIDWDDIEALELALNISHDDDNDSDDNDDDNDDDLFGGFNGDNNDDDGDDDDNDSDNNDDEPEEIVLTDEEITCMEQAQETVEDHLRENGWNYDTHQPRKDVFVFDMGCHSGDVSLRIKIYVEARPNVCRISVILPVSASKTYQYPVCVLLANLNYRLRFGAFKYDERDGELSYEYSVLTNNGLTPEDFEQYMRACIGTSLDAYDQLRKYAVGRFKRSEKLEMKSKIKKMLEDIDSDND